MRARTQSPARRCAVHRWMILGLISAISLAASSFARPLWAEPIKSIQIIDNSKTTDDTVLLIANIEVGDDFKPEMVDRIKADLVNSGLFKSVEVGYGPATGGGVDITISAADKHSWVVAPTYYDQPTNRGGGVGFGENNLFGENEKLLLYAQLATGDSFFIGAYIDPSIAGTRFKWQLDTYLLSTRSIEYAPPTEYIGDADPEPRQIRVSRLNYLNAGATIGVNLFRGASIDARLRGAKVFYDDTRLGEGATVEDLGLDPETTPVDAIPEPGAEGYDISTEVILQYDRRANWYGISHGDRYRLNYERALTPLGSDFDYWQGTVSFQRARRHYTRHNSILNFSVSYGRDLPYQQEFTAGGTSQRGYLNQQFRGDFKAAATFEYSVPVISVKGVSLRLLGFFDSTYAAFLDKEDTDTFRNYLPQHGEHLGLTPLKNSVGLGTRLYIRQIVLPLLGLDVGYGLERRDWEIYLAIGLTDV